MNWLRKHGTFERLLGKKHKVSIGQAQGVAKSEAKARELCEEAAADILMNARTPTFEVRDGFLIGRGIESSTSAWYFIRSIEDMQSEDITKRLIFPQCFMHPRGLKQAIESHLAQLLEDREPPRRIAPAATLSVGNGASPEVFSVIAGVRKITQRTVRDAPFLDAINVCFECEFGPAESFQVQLQKFIHAASPSNPANFHLKLQNFADDDDFYFSAYALEAKIIDGPFYKFTEVTLRIVGKLSIDVAAAKLDERMP